MNKKLAKRILRNAPWYSHKYVVEAEKTLRGDSK